MKLSKAYEPNQYESTIYDLWEKAGAFKPLHRGSKKSFSIVVPPPNANGNLHIGHGLNHAVMDIMVRYHRMKGEAALLLPGADHAGFETQVVYEKQLAKEGKSRFDLTRDQLYDQIYEFVNQNKDNYQSQFRKLGDSVDWSRYVFTLDQKIIDRAYKTFKKMWDDKLIYRGERLVNFCTFHGTAFADIEVAYQEDKGHLWYIRYPLTDGSGEMVVATTRPETMLGDTAVAVHPDDKRYKKFIGKTARLPLTNREIPILADNMVDPKFGTGAVKITPAHDINDYEVGKRHDLPFITIIDHEGKLSGEVPEQYRGLPVADGRKQVVSDLEAGGFLTKTEAISHSVGHCYKCGTVIEPLLRDQWFIDMKPLAAPAIAALEKGAVKFYPEAKQKQLINYLGALRDWNISRQIAWGIPIPAFQNINNPDDWIYDERVGEELIEVNGQTYKRDPDVFDTWFSSSSWPYATLDFPDGDDFNEFYPLSVMETGADILYPWVSRMLMFGLYVTGKVPFESVYLHGLVLDEHGAKMSKSKGNVIDPMVKVDQFGSDAFRMGIIAGQTPGNNQPYDESKLIGARNFCNKLWNVARFIEDKLGDQANLNVSPEPQTPADHWMMCKLQRTTGVVSELLDDNRLGEASEAVYHLLWDDLADWYIEASKTALTPSVLAYSLQTVLTLAHPFAPFVTETIWQTLSGSDSSLLATSSWPVVPDADRKLAKQFEQAQAIVTEARAISSALKTTELTLYYHSSPELDNQDDLIAQLTRLTVKASDDQPSGLQLKQTKHAVWLDVSTKAAKAYTDDLAAQKQQQEQLIKQLQGRLSNKSYVKNAPEAVVQQTKDQLADAEAKLAAIQTDYERFKDL